MTCYNISVGQGAPCASGCGPVPTENRQPSHVYRDNSMAALPYIQLHIAEYLADTAHLTPAQHGAYLLLIFNYWQRAESLNNSNERLACVARMSNSEWAENNRFRNIRAHGEWFHATKEILSFITSLNGVA